MKNFESILFDDFKYKVKSCKKDTDFLKDLNIVQIVDAIISSKKEYDIEPFFYTPLADRDLVLYRQQVMSDLQNRELFDLIKEYEKLFSSIKTALKNSEKLNNIYQKSSWCLKAATLYKDGIIEFERRFEKIKKNSIGFKKFYDYIKSYISSKRFTDLCKSCDNLQNELNKINYYIRIKEGCVELMDMEGLSNYEDEIDALFERFTQDSTADEVEFSDNAIELNHVEDKILNMVVHKYDKTFSLVEDFYKKNHLFMDEKLKKFDNEIQFYLSFLEFIEPIGFDKFSFAEISNDKNIYAYGFFDLLLASKLQKECKEIVDNDFYMDANEKAIVITGPNQGGKTTFARAVGELFYFNSLGCPVPAKKAKLFLQNAIFTHFEREESVENLRSKLEDDIERIKSIIENAKQNSVVIVNEIFSSTTLEDALWLSKKIIDSLLKKDILLIWVTFIDEISKLDKKVVSMVSLVDHSQNNKKTYKIVRQEADGKAYAKSIAKRYSLSYEDIVKRIK